MALRFVLVTVLALSASPAPAQDRLEQVRELYAAADYDGALAELDRLPAAPATGEQLERDHYRAMALIALGRTAEAQAAIERIVLADPRYELSDEEAAPRIRLAFNDVRRRVLPQMARSLYSDGKSAFDRKDMAQALPAFERALVVIDLVPAGEPGMADLRTLTAGFLQLSRASAAEAGPAPTGSAGHTSAPPAVATSGVSPSPTTAAGVAKPAGPPSLAPATPAPNTSAPVTSAPATEPPASAPAPAVPAATDPSAAASASHSTSAPAPTSPPATSPSATPATSPAASTAASPPPSTAEAVAAPSTAAAAPPPSAAAGAVTMTEPVILRQELPPWRPAKNEQQQFSGIIEVDIDERGDVVAARMINAVHPLYDPLLLAAARHWKYEPARRGGMAVKSSKRIAVVLHPY